MTVEVFVDRLPEGIHTRELTAESFADLYRRSREPLVAYCRRLLAGRGDPEAVAQEAFLNAWTAWDHYSPSRPFWPWVATIARRLCHDNWRRVERTSGREHVLTRLSSQVAPQPDEQVEAAEDGRLALEAFHRLAPAQQRIVGLRDLEGWAYEDIAEFEGVTVESIRGSLRRARAALRTAYGKLAAGVPALIGLPRRWLPRRRATALSARIDRVASSAPAFDRVGDTILGMVALAMVAASPAPVAPADERAPVPTVSSEVGAAPSGPAAAAGGLAAARTARPAFEGEQSSTGGGASTGTEQPAAADAPAPSSPLPVAIPSDGGDTPEDVAFHQIVASPNADHDGTVFAAGTVGTGCRFPPCAALFRSSDRGRTWARLPAAGFAGGTLMLPPSYPDDERLFVAGPGALQVSSDGGATFTGLTPVGGPAAMSPSFSTGDPVILVGAAPGWEYDDARRTVTPLTMAPAASSPEATFAFGPGERSTGTVLVGSAVASPTGPQAGVTACKGSACGTTTILPGVAGTPSLLAPASIDGLVLAWRNAALFRSVDGGATFEPQPLPLAGKVTALTDDAAGTLYLTLHNVDGGHGGGLFTSTDGGQTWRSASGTSVLNSGAGAVAALPSGRLLAAPALNAGGGLLCSDDAGQTWRDRCAA